MRLEFVLKSREVLKNDGDMRKDRGVILKRILLVKFGKFNF